MSIEKMLEACKTELEVRNFANAQQKTLLTLMKKNKSLEDQVEELKKLVVNGALPIIGQESPSPLQVGSDAEEIAKIEINKLKMRAMDSESLMLEEAKKLEIYNKILTNKVDDKNKKNEREVREIDAEALLAIAEAPEKAK